MEETYREIYFGYCFPKRDGWYTPKVTLESPEAAWSYCVLQCLLFEEIRITDGGDNLVMHVVNKVLKIGENDEFRYIHLLEHRIARKEEEF